ncbi:MAG TPA: hypothetical protein VEV45_08225 [Streptosporangiaceae bacterium]|nr:hypothetical protein [Streptosporangiaceae bacterium]
MLQTPVVRFEHPKSGRSVTVVATMHKGSAAYYQQLRTVIDEMEAAGAVVCMEGADSSEQDWAAASGEERAAVARYYERRAPRLAEAASRYLGWVDQSAALGSSPSWRKADMARLELVRQAGPQNMLGLWVPGNEFGRLTPDQQEALAGAGYSIGVRLEQFPWLTDLMRRLFARLAGDASRRIDDVVVEGRNRFVLASLPGDSDAALPWGAGHLPGLAAGLRKAGYRRRETTWLTVGALPAVWPSVRLFWTEIRPLWAAIGTEDRTSPETRRPNSAA